MKKLKVSPDLITQWLTLKNWKLLPFQQEAWDQDAQGKSGLISVPTGAGKTYAAYLPALLRLHRQAGKGIHILYITPLRALAKDLEYALKKPLEELGLPYRVEKRTGDTTATAKSKQKKSPPEILLTTPESLSLLLTDPEAASKFSRLQTIIIDEWHELLSSKRGVLLELCLSKLKSIQPKVQIWGLTATIGNLQEAAQICVGCDRLPVIVTAKMPREVILDAILPESFNQLPWSGYLGLRLLPEVLKQLDPLHPTLIFTNTRAQAEKWFQAILEKKPDWAHLMALHHSSIDKKSRELIEEGLKVGRLSFVICTSSLDLGIDLPHVEKVIQIGSPKSIARLIQRAGRSSHQPLTPCHIAIVPTHALELLELKSYRLALSEGLIEERQPFKNCYDVLIQYLTTCAIGGGFEAASLFAEIKTTVSYAELSRAEFDRCLQFLVSGGEALQAYPEYKKLILKDQLYCVEDPLVIRRHKMNSGTISSDPTVTVKLMKGKTLGLVEESFLTQLKTGDTFLFAGRRLKLVQYRDLTAYVRLTEGTNTQTPSWKGNRLPFSAPLGHVLRRALTTKDIKGTEEALLKELLHLQHMTSHLPQENELLIEVLKSREGWHLFIYPFEGKTIHEGLALLVAHRLSKMRRATLTLSCNDYGFEILSNQPFDLTFIKAALFSADQAQQEMQGLTNLQEASKGCFRDIARIAGLCFPGFPGKHKSHRQVHISTSLLFEVFQKYDPTNLLLEQAKREVWEKQVGNKRFESVLARLYSAKLVIRSLEKMSPLALPLFIERVSERLSTESLLERIQNIQASWQVEEK